MFLSGQGEQGRGGQGFILGSHVYGGSGHLVKRNAAVGNTGPGMLAETADLIITQNDLFGNDAAGNNCGLENDSGAALTAEDNYWGATTGPGNEPADDTCETDGTIDADPFATKEISVPPGAGR